MSELKPCPFCGNDKIILLDDFHPSCPKCGAIQNCITGNYEIEHWNERAIPTGYTLVHVDVLKTARDNVQQELDLFVSVSDWSVLATAKERRILKFKKQVAELNQLIDKAKVVKN